MIPTGDDLKDAIRDYWSQRAVGFSLSTRILLEDESIVRYYLNYLTGGKGSGRALDLCTGCGNVAIELARIGYEVVGIDNSMEMVGEASKNADLYGYDIDFIVGDATEPGFEEQSFDMITVKDGLWNLLDPKRAYRNWVRLLKPGGSIIVFDANHYLHFGNEDYRLRKEYMDEKYGVDSDLHGRTNVNNVDLTIIDRLAEGLPLSYRERPSWDVGVLLKCGMVGVQTCILDRETFTVRKENHICETPFCFVLRAQKPFGRREENAGSVDIKDLRQIAVNKSRRVDDFLKILANTNCLKILYALNETSLSVTDISEMFGISVSLVSHDLKMMRRAGLLQTKRSGKYLMYSLKNPIGLSYVLQTCEVFGSDLKREYR